MKKIAKKYLFLSVAFSLAIHIAAFFGLYQHFLSFYKNVISCYTEKEDRICKKIPKNKVLRVTFQKEKSKKIIVKEKIIIQTDLTES